MDTKRVRKLKDRAAKLLAKDDLDGALTVYRQIRELHPKDTAILHKIGECSRRMGKRGEAVDAFHEEAQLYAIDGMLLRSIAICKVILEIEPSHRVTQEMLATLYTRRFGAAPGPAETGATQNVKPEVTADSGTTSHPEPGELEISIEVDLSELDTNGVNLEDLPQIPLFSSLSPESFVELIQRMPLRRFASGDIIVQRGSPADAFFVIVEGTVRVINENLADDGDIATLGPGSFFGEMALLTHRPRLAAVEAAESVELLEISRETVDELVKKYPSVHQQLTRFTDDRLIHHLLLTSSIFTPFSLPERQTLRDRFSRVSIDKGEAVIQQGDAASALFLIVRGKADVIRVLANGEETLVSTLDAGDIFGEMSLLTRSSATATVRANLPLELLQLPKSAFDELIMTHPQILELVSQLMDERRKDNASLLRRQLVSERAGGTALL